MRTLMGLLCTVLALVGVACVTASSAPPKSNALPQHHIDLEHWLGPAVAVENLTVFAVYAKGPSDTRNFTTLELAMSTKSAVVREVATSDGARVDTVVIENKGKVPILVLAGTIIKGGNQDRQIGEDFIVEPRKTVDVSAFCIEQGRWTGTREGESTGGTFRTSKTLANGAVRAAGQYGKDQSDVWAEVEAANKLYKKSSSSGTLLVSVDDAEIGKRRTTLALAASKALAKEQEQDRIVGFAYAVNGQVRGVRYFAGPKLFALFRETLFETAALDAVSAQVAAADRGDKSAPVVAERGAVVKFIDDMKSATVSDRKVSGSQEQSLKKGEEGYASELLMVDPSPPSKHGKPKGKKPITVDLYKK